MHEELAYLQRIQNALSTLAELSMVAASSTNGLRYVAYYDDDDSEWVIQREWYGDDGQLIENEMVRYQDFADAVNAAYDIVQDARP